MNVLHVVESLTPDAGGPARSVPGLGEAIQKIGSDVQLYVNNKEIDGLSESRIALTSLPVKPIRKLSSTVQELKVQGTDKGPREKISKREKRKKERKKLGLE